MRATEDNPEWIDYILIYEYFVHEFSAGVIGVVLSSDWLRRAGELPKYRAFMHELDWLANLIFSPKTTSCSYK